MVKEVEHIAIILDGNRRYAKKVGIPQFKGHEKGFGKIKDLLKWCVELKIKEVTLYCFSTENFKRGKKEVNYLFNLFRKQFDAFSREDVIHKNKVRINVIGRLSMFPKDMQERMRDIMNKTRKYKNYKLNLALAYGGRAEIIDAVKHMLKNKKLNIKGISETTLKKHLYLEDEPDLLIRPGGEKRLSNFLTWQSAYTELIFLNKYWPEITKKDLVRCVKEYKGRERRFGK